MKRILEVISKNLTQKTDPTLGIPHMSGNGGLKIIINFQILLMFLVGFRVQKNVTQSFIFSNTFSSLT